MISKLGKVDDTIPILQLARFKSKKQRQIEKDGFERSLILDWKIVETF